MKTILFAALAAATLVTIAGCKKSEESTATPGASAVTTTTAADPCGAFVDKLANTAKKPPDAEGRRVFGEVCKAVSPGVRSCVVGAADLKAIDVCMEPEKEKVMGVMFGAAMAKEKARAGQASVAKLEKVGVVLDVTGDAEVADGIEKGSQMFGSATTGTVIVSEVPARSKKTLAAAKKEANEFLNAKNLKDGTLSNGYWLSYENTGSLGKNYFVQSNHDLGKKTVRCESRTDSAEKAAAALTVCKSLRAN